MKEIASLKEMLLWLVADNKRADIEDYNLLNRAIAHLQSIAGVIGVHMPTEITRAPIENPVLFFEKNIKPKMQHILESEEVKKNPLIRVYAQNAISLLGQYEKNILHAPEAAATENSNKEEKQDQK